MLAIIAFFFVIASLFALQEAMGNTRVRYKFTPTGIQIMWFMFDRWLFIPYQEIKEIREATFWEKFIGLLTGTQDHILRRAILITRKNKVLGEISLSPRRTDEFLAELRGRIEKANAVSKEEKMNVVNEVKQQQKKSYFGIVFGLLLMIVISVFIDDIMHKILEWMP
jgi:hypothetical protein